MTVFQTRPVTGFAGAISRPSNANVEARAFDPAAVAPALPKAYGVPVKYNGDYLEAFQALDVAADIVGILARTAPTIGGSTQQTFTVSEPNAVTNQNLLVSGYVNVVCTDGDPSLGQPVYVRTLENLPALVGDLESVNVPGENEIIPGYVWNVSGRDANNISEIRLKV